MRARSAFTLIELLVVIAVVGVLVGVLVPSLSATRKTAQRVRCLTNVRGMETAHWLFMMDNNGQFVNAGLSHTGGPSAEDAEASWLQTLEAYYGSTLLARSPVDDSPYWDEPVPGPGRRRVISYGINNFLANVVQNNQNPHGPPPGFWNPGMMGPWPGGDGHAFDNLDRVPRPAATVHFLMMAFTGSFAAADHVHADDWFSAANPYRFAAGQAQTNAHGGTFEGPDARSNWGFLDGHAETLELSQLIGSPALTNNNFNPLFAK